MEKEKNIQTQQLIKNLKAMKNKDLDVYQLSDGCSPTEVKQFVSSGLRKLDMLMSNRIVGGFPVGKLTTITGQQGSGKTLIAMMAAKNVIERNGTVIWIDTQNSLDLVFLQSFGIKRQKLVYIQLNTVEAMFEVMDNVGKSIRQKNSDQLILVVVDSLAGLSTKKQVEGDVGDSTYGGAARLLSQGLRKFIVSFGKMRVCMIFTNQLRYKMNARMFEDPLSAMYGGKAVPYYSSIMMKLRKKAKIKIGQGTDKQIVGNQIGVTIEKNRLAPPFRKTNIQCIYDHGVSQINQIMQNLKDMDIVKVSGPSYTWKGGPCKDQKFAKKDFPKYFNNKQVNDYIWQQLGKKYILDVSRITDADSLSGQGSIIQLNADIQKDVQRQ